MSIDLNTRSTCRNCSRAIVYRLPMRKDGVPEESMVSARWYHDDERPDWQESDRYWGTGRQACRTNEHGGADPTTVCNHMLGTDAGGRCGRKIPADNQREGIYACGIHAKHERQAQAREEANRLRNEKEVEQADLRAWARKALGDQVAEILESGLAVKWKSGKPDLDDRRYGYSERDPETVVTVHIEDLLDFVRRKTSVNAES